jgi:hypothetical protein
MPHPHGTINRYNNQRCRCDPCRAAIRDYRRAQRASSARATPTIRATATADAPASSTTPAGPQSRAAPERVQPPRRPALPRPTPRPSLAPIATPLTAEQLEHLTIGARVVWRCGHVNNWRTPGRTAPPCLQCGTSGVIGSTTPTAYADIPVITPGR